MNIDEMKQTWEEMSRRLSQLENDNENLKMALRAERNNTSLDRLANRYKRFTILSAVMIFFSFIYINILPEQYRLVTSIGSAIFFAVATSMDAWLYKGIKSIDVTKMTVSEVYELARFYRRRHLNFIVILLPVSFVLVGWFIYMFREDEEALWGIGIGGVVGLTIGTYNLLRFMNDYKSIK